MTKPAIKTRYNFTFTAIYKKWHYLCRKYIKTFQPTIRTKTRSYFTQKTLCHKSYSQIYPQVKSPIWKRASSFLDQRKLLDE